MNASRGRPKGSKNRTTLTDAIVEEALKSREISTRSVKELCETVDRMMEPETRDIDRAEAQDAEIDSTWDAARETEESVRGEMVEWKDDANRFRGRISKRKEALRIKREVMALKGFGFTNEQVALMMGVSVNTLSNRYGEELKKGALIQNAAVLRNLHSIATNPEHRGSTQAAIFWAKARAGWTETTRTEVTGADGQPLKMEVSQAKVLDSSKLSPEHREKLREVLEAAIAQEAAMPPVSEEKIAVEEEEEIDFEPEGDDEDDPA